MSTHNVDLPLAPRAARAPRLRTALALLTLFALSAFAAPVPTADAAGGAHPYFNDGGALRWHVRFADAQRAARAEGKLIFVEAGRRRCSMCRKLCAETLAARSVRGRLRSVAVGLAAEVDHPERPVANIIARHLSGARMLPLCWFMTPDGRYVAGFWGKRSPQQFLAFVAKAEAAQRAARKRSACSSETTEKAAPESASPGVVKVTPPPAPVSPPAQPTVSPPAQPSVSPPAQPTVSPAQDVETPAQDVEHAEGCPDGDHIATQESADTECANGACDCPGGDCAYDGGKPAVPDFLGPEASPSATPRPATTAPPVTPRTADAVADNGPAPRTDAPRATGTPDGEAAPLPAPEIRTIRKPAAPRLRPAAKNQGTWQRAREAAAREQWGKVLKTIGEDAARDPALLRLAREAHQWAHEQLEAAARHLEAGRADEARKLVDVVKREMTGYAAAEDARRGYEAIEYLEDLSYLSETSSVRRAVRQRAFDRLRGSRWARLFSPAK